MVFLPWFMFHVCASFQRLQQKVIKIVDVSYGGENGFNQAIELAADALANVKFIQEKKLIGKYMHGRRKYLVDHTCKGKQKFSLFRQSLGHHFQKLLRFFVDIISKSMTWLGFASNFNDHVFIHFIILILLVIYYTID